MWQRIWPAQRWLIIELFVIANLAFLALDVYLAHAINFFRVPSEWLRGENKCRSKQHSVKYRFKCHG